MKARVQFALSQRWLARKRTIAVTVTSLLFAASLVVWAADMGKKPAGKPGNDGGQAAANAVPPAKPDTVHIIIQTVPPRRAQVRWGRKSLGTIPAPRALVVERPRDSGPLDLIIRASGFMPVHTRAYTFSDSRVAVKLTPPSEKSKLFGYREEPQPSIDGGVPDATPPKP